MTGTVVTRQILWNIPAAFITLLYGLSALAGLWIVFWFVRRSRRWRQGTSPIEGTDLKGFKQLAVYLLTHRTLRRDRYAGAMHLLIFWGFLIELVATTLVAIQHHCGVIFLTGTTYLAFSFVSDLGGVALAIGLGMALWRRSHAASLGRLTRDRSTTGVIALLFAITLTGFLVEAARIAKDFPAFEKWSIAGYTIACLLERFGIAGPIVISVHRYLWVTHAAFVLVFFALIPVGLMRHILLGAYNVMLAQRKPGRFRVAVDVLHGENDLARFRQSDLMQADACVSCGRCTEVCPAEAAGKPLSPRSVVLGLRASLNHRQPVGRFVTDSALWSCTTCHACDTACPLHIGIVDKIVTLRRDRVWEGKIPESAAQALESAAQKHNPFGKPNSTRLEWASGLNVPVAAEDEAVDLLYWVGCAGAFDPAGKEVTRSMVRILSHLKVSYRVLGCGERCSGDPARRMGEEGLWRELAAHNQSSFLKHRVKTILTSCPHCANAFANEYPAVGEMPQVLHHSQWIRARLDEGSLAISGQRGEKITFHDPCYLSRAGGEIEAPRAILDALFEQTRVEMSAHGKNSLCCGGGGGQMWLDVRGKTRVETVRALQVERSGAQTVAAGCPFCRVMLEAGRATLPEGQGKWQVRDLAELVAETLPTGGQA